MQTTIYFALPTLIFVSVASACGSRPTPEPAASAEAAEGGEHTMPDGTKMQGHDHHSEGSQAEGEHTMPDGTKMKGHHHGDAPESEHEHE